MKRLIPLVLLFGGLFGQLAAADEAPAPLEAEVAAIIASDEVTLVHFWAPWCPNCRAEMVSGGWRKFLEENPAVKVVFINIWHRGQDPHPKLEAAGLVNQSNLIVLTHPNASRASDERLKEFLGLPVTWVPTTWVFRQGQLRFAFNYGEMRFDILQRLVDDSRDAWRHN